LCGGSVNADEHTEVVVNAERNHRDDVSLIASSRDGQGVQDQAKSDFVAKLGLDRVTTVLGVTSVEDNVVLCVLVKRLPTCYFVRTLWFSLKGPDEMIFLLYHVSV
jgi:hypothetical protein